VLIAVRWNRFAYQVEPISTRRFVASMFMKVVMPIARPCALTVNGTIEPAASSPRRRSISDRISSGPGTTVYQSFQSSPSRVASASSSWCSCESGRSATWRPTSSVVPGQGMRVPISDQRWGALTASRAGGGKPVANAWVSLSDLDNGDTAVWTGQADANGAFTGVFTLTRFVVQNGQVAAVGTLTGTVTNAAGVTIGAIVRTLTVPLISITGTCDILHLELGPLDLNLLGLVVHLDKIVLDIDAQSGPGNLLGNLLCAVAHLLDGGGPLTVLVNLLNQILGILT